MSSSYTPIINIFTFVGLIRKISWAQFSVSLEVENKKGEN